MNDNIKLIINKKQIYHAGIVILFIISSFISGYELGKKWGGNHQSMEDNSFSLTNDYFIKNSIVPEEIFSAVKSQESLEANYQIPDPKTELAEKLTDSKTEVDLPNTEVSQNFVASRNGTKFYPVGCKSADRIKTENRVYFGTKDEAVRAGLEEATSC